MAILDKGHAHTLQEAIVGKRLWKNIWFLPVGKAWIKEVYKEVVPLNIVQVCTDNASVILEAMRILEMTYRHLYSQGCAAHILDLLFEDWRK